MFFYLNNLFGILVMSHLNENHTTHQIVYIAIISRSTNAQTKLLLSIISLNTWMTSYNFTFRCRFVSVSFFSFFYSSSSSPFNFQYLSSSSHTIDTIHNIKRIRPFVSVSLLCLCLCPLPLLHFIIFCIWLYLDCSIVRFIVYFVIFIFPLVILFALVRSLRFSAEWWKSLNIFIV